VTTGPGLSGQLRRVIGLIFAVQATDAATDLALAAVRTALAWIFIWYGAGKLFGTFNGPGFHQTVLFMANTATCVQGVCSLYSAE